MRPENATVGCGQKLQHHWSHATPIRDQRPPWLFVVKVLVGQRWLHNMWTFLHCRGVRDITKSWTKLRSDAFTKLRNHTYIYASSLLWQIAQACNMLFHYYKHLLVYIYVMIPEYENVYCTPVRRSNTGSKINARANIIWCIWLSRYLISNHITD